MYITAKTSAFWLGVIAMMAKTSENDIIEQLLQFNVGTREEIVNGINNSINKNDINEITQYIITNKEKQINSVCYTCLWIA